MLVTMASPRITEEQARDARARALRFVFDCYSEKKAAHPGHPDDVNERPKNDSHAKSTIPK